MAIVRFGLVVALVVIAGALALVANLFLLGYAQRHDDPVGQLTPQALAQGQPAGGSAANAKPLSPHAAVPHKQDVHHEYDD